jgi:thymidylate synthase (FAD)
MKVLEQYVETMGDINGEEILWRIEAAARNCYKSEGANAEKSEAKRDALIRHAVRRGHTSVLEHGSISFRVVSNRGVSHEWVRHRVGWSYSQESTRYCNYGHGSSEITVIWPWFLGGFAGEEALFDLVAEHPNEVAKMKVWVEAMRFAEDSYLKLLALGCKPEEARDVLPNGLKTEIVCTANIVSLRHFFKLRCAKAAHPQIRSLAIALLGHLCETSLKILFEDQYEQFITKGEEA